MWGLVYTRSVRNGADCDEKMLCRGIGLMAKLSSSLLNLLDGGALFWQNGLGLLKQQKMIVPGAKSLLRKFETGC